jgi:NitT/TauT family transport system permease protein
MNSLFQPNAILSHLGNRFLAIGWVIVLLLVASLLSVPLFPKPLAIVTAWQELLGHGLLPELWVSFKLNVEAIVITTILSLLLVYASLMPIIRPFVSFISKNRAIGFVGLTVFFTLATSGIHQFKLSLLVYGMLVWFVTSMLTQLDAIPSDQYDHARTLGMSRWRIVWEVVVRGKADTVVDVMRENAAIGWMLLPMVEGVARSEGGIGVMLLNYNKYLRLDAVFALILTILIVVLVQDWFLGFCKKLLFPYSALDTEKK